LARPDVQERLATALHHAGRFAEAAAILETLIKDEADSPGTAAASVASGVNRVSLRLMLAECLLEDAQVERARTQAGRAVRDEPRNVAALLLLARIQTQMGRYADALETAERVLRIDAQRSAALELASALAWRVGNRNRAVLLARRLLSIEGQQDNPIAREILVSVAAGAKGGKSVAASGDSSQQ
jgi:tetratricopeptide (TPR) repeat protein